MEGQPSAVSFQQTYRQFRTVAVLEDCNQTWRGGRLVRPSLSPGPPQSRIQAIANLSIITVEGRTPSSVQRWRSRATRALTLAHEWIFHGIGTDGRFSITCVIRCRSTAGSSKDW